MKPAILICTLLLYFSGWPQAPDTTNPPPKINQLRFEKYDFRQGLSNPLASCIYQDKAGFLWIGTNFGLNRYDGIRFENYYHEQSQPNSLVHNTVLSVTEDKNGFLWIGTDEGVTAFNPRTHHFINYSSSGKGIHKFNKTRCVVYADSANNIWVGHEKGITILDASRSTFKDIAADFNRLDTTTKGLVNGFTEDNEFIYTATANGMLRINKKSFVAEPLGDQSNPKYHAELLRISKDATGRIWASNWGGEIYWYDPTDKQFHYKTIDNVSIMDVIVTRENNKEYIFISTFKGLVKMELTDFFAGHPVSYYVPDRDNPFSISHRILGDLFQDKDNNIWISSETGLNKIDPSSSYFTVYPYGHFNTDFAMYSMCTTDIAGEYYVLSGSHIFRLNREKGILNAVSFAGKYGCYDLFRTANTYWLTVNGGLLQLNKDLQVKAHYKLPFDKISLENRFRWIMQNTDGSLWISTARSGIIRFDTATKTLQRIFHDPSSPINLNGNYVETMAVDHSNRVWIGTAGGLFIYDNKSQKAEKVTLCNLTNNMKGCENVKYLYEHKGKMFICTMAGLYAYDLRSDNINYISINGQGISHIINAVITDDKDRLWLNTNNGLVVFDPSSGKAVLLGQKNGLPYQDLWSRMYWFNNEIFTSTGANIVCFHPDQLKQDNTVPPPVFSSIVVNDTSFVENSATNPLRWNGSIAFSFISLQYKNSNPAQYAYLLEGLDKSWHVISDNRSLRFSNLPAGNYLLKVKAINSDGAESAPALFAFSVRPPFWKTWWFITLALLTAAGVIYSIYRYRIRQAIRLERMRMRIATDLHDDIGATLSSISMYSDAVKKQVKTSLPHLEPVLDKMGENSRSMVSSMSDIVWAINPKNDEGEKLLERMENYGKDTCSVRNILFTFQADKKIHAVTLELEQRKNIYLIFKEAINNALKYADATEIRTEINTEGRNLIMTIADNGCGFDEKTVRKGNGLQNMRQRANEIGGRLLISSDQDGTRICFKC
jgi:ligand-binding sensor domain-containing protein/two-component sensor histidine kinase